MDPFELLTKTATIADPRSVTDDGVFSLVRFATQAFREGEWALGAGLTLTVLVALFRLMGMSKLIPNEYDKYVATGIAVLTSVAIGLQSGEHWSKIVSTGLAIGLMAVGGWETIGTQVRKAARRRKGKTQGAPAPASPAPPDTNV